MKTIPFADLECLLLEHGFHRIPAQGKQQVYRNTEEDALMVFPPYEPTEAILPRHLLATRTQLDALGLLSVADFDRWLENANQKTEKQAA
jgi:hypothetical protein